MSQAFGTDRCPLCGVNRPHGHDAHELERLRLRKKQRDAFEESAQANFKVCGDLRVNAWGSRSDDPFNVNCRGKAWNHRNEYGSPFDYWDPKVEQLWKFFLIAWNQIVQTVAPNGEGG